MLVLRPHHALYPRQEGRDAAEDPSTGRVPVDVGEGAQQKAAAALPSLPVQWRPVPVVLLTICPHYITSTSVKVK